MRKNTASPEPAGSTTKTGLISISGRLAGWDGSIESLACQSRRPHSHPNQHTAAELKLIRPYTSRHNGKVERSHREDQKRFYSVRSFFSLDDFQKQLAVHNRRSNNLPMRPLRRLSPIDFLDLFG